MYSYQAVSLQNAINYFSKIERAVAVLFWLVMNTN